MKNYLDILFNPQSVAIFGASNEQGKVGAMIMNNIVACGYRGKVFPINPNKKYEGKDIFGYKVYPSIENVSEKIDLAVIVVPRKVVKNMIVQCIENTIRTAIIIPAGFGETNEEGKKDEKELTRIAENGNLKFVGPNTMGFWSANISLNVSMGYMSPLPGNVSIISQSGSTGVVICSELRGMGVGIRYFVSSGNEASLSFEDYLEYFINDNETKIIAGFLEGLRKRNKFLNICKKNVTKKPIIILKAGTTDPGIKAASSHTGSISGSDEVYNATFKQYGILRAQNINQFLDLIRAFICINLPEGNRVAILPGAGGMGVLTADASDKAGLNVAKPSQGLINKINEILPDYWSHSNPFDPVGTQDLSVFPTLLELLLESNEYDCVITNVIEIRSLLEQYFPQHDEGKQIKQMMIEVMDSTEKSVARRQIKILNKYRKPVVFISHVYPNSKLFRIFEKKNVLIVKNPDSAAFVLKSLYEYNRFLKKIKENSQTTIQR
ncbi:MAG: CoA-binding protein [Candidatus Helarchaeota archaeon]|nr:CoA-binding protein [Candidatus Helarchaeota archaeon]